MLQLDPSNIYAANGLGAVFAVRNQLTEAKDFFIQVRETSQDFPDVMLNIAQVHLSQGLNLNAIKMVSSFLSTQIPD